jgi:hypothetical protein
MYCLKFCHENVLYVSSVSRMRMSLFERVSYVDVILKMCHLFGLHCWSFSHFGRRYSSLLRIWTSILIRVSFGLHYLSVSRIWTSFLKRVAYLGSILEAFPILAFPILDVIIQVCCVFWRQSWRVSHLDVIIRACLVCGRHSWSVSLIWAPFLKSFPFLTSLFKFVAYLDVNLDACPIWTSLFERVSYVDVILEVCRLFGLHYWTISHLDVIIQVCRLFGHRSWSVSRHTKEWEELTNFVHVAFIIPLQVYLYSYVVLMQMKVKAEKTCQIIEKAFGKYVFRGSTSFHFCWMSFKTLLW